jgi:hypothetical protein
MNTVQKKLQKAKQEKFLDALYEMGTIERAATVIKIARKTVYNWIHADKAFASKMEKLLPQAKQNYLGVLEQEAHRRAVEGIDKPVYYKGDLVDTVKEYSDTLLIVLLKGNAPEKYRDRQEITGANGGPVQLQWVEDGNDKTG